MVRHLLYRASSTHITPALRPLLPVRPTLVSALPDSAALRLRLLPATCSWSYRCRTRRLTRRTGLPTAQTTGRVAARRPSTIQVSMNTLWQQTLSAQVAALSQYGAQARATDSSTHTRTPMRLLLRDSAAFRSCA